MIKSPYSSNEKPINPLIPASYRNRNHPFEQVHDWQTVFCVLPKLKIIRLFFTGCIDAFSTGAFSAAS